MNLTLLIVVILTAIALVGIALGVARIVSPRSYNRQKGEAYECGIPTRGRSWMQFKAGYYLFAILFLMFDVEAVFLFPWAVTVQDAGIDGLIRGTGMEVKKGKSKRLKAKSWRGREGESQNKK